MVRYRDKRAAQRQYDVPGDRHRSLRSSLPDAAVRHQHTLQKASGKRRRIHSRGVLGTIGNTITKSTGTTNMMFLVLFVPLLLQTRDALFGTWQLASSSGPSAYSRVTCKIEPWQEGVRVVYDMVGLRGGITHWEWTGKLDGKDYPLEGIEENVTD